MWEDETLLIEETAFYTFSTLKLSGVKRTRSKRKQLLPGILSTERMQRLASFLTAQYCCDDVRHGIAKH